MSCESRSCRTCIHWCPCAKRESAEGFLTPCASGGYTPNAEYEIIRQEMFQITAKFCADYLNEDQVPNWNHNTKKQDKPEGE